MITILESIWKRFINKPYLRIPTTKDDISKRRITFRHSDSSLTSKRVSIILSSPVDSKKLVDAVRALRYNRKGKATFKLTARTKNLIDEETRKLGQA
tara:strand:- start:280 stop:570 length:291 start_codon:yes stop_codon:yes gene_type:complete